MKVIWLDDEREPYNFLYEDYGYKEEDITVCKNYSQFVKAISKNGLPEMICFDHDLGEEKTGYDCAKFLVDYCLKVRFHLPLTNSCMRMYTMLMKTKLTDSSKIQNHSCRNLGNRSITNKMI